MRRDASPAAVIFVGDGTNCYRWSVIEEEGERGYDREGEKHDKHHRYGREDQADKNDPCSERPRKVRSVSDGVARARSQHEIVRASLRDTNSGHASCAQLLEHLFVWLGRSQGELVRKILG